MRKSTLFDRCLDWMFEAYVRATTRPEVKDYLTRYPDADRALVRMIVKIGARVLPDVEIDARMVNFGESGEYLEVTVWQNPGKPDFASEIQAIWDEEVAQLRVEHGWIALIADDRTPHRRVECVGKN